MMQPKTKKIIKKSKAIKIPPLHYFKDRSLVLFGASKGGEFVFRKLLSRNIKIDYFCDNNSNLWGKKLFSIKIISPRQLAGLDRNTNIIVSSEFFFDIADQLKKMKFKNIYPFEAVTPSLFTRLFEAKHIATSKKKILQAVTLLADDQSKKVLEGVIDYRLNLDYQKLKKVVSDNQYFPKDIFNFGLREIFIDVGAYQGENTFQFMGVVKDNFKKAFLFEPDVKNYDYLKTIVRKRRLNNKIVLSQLGVFSIPGKIRFLSEYNGAFSKIDETGLEEISTTSIDDYFKDKKVTFIKMDIEGAEMKALMGARKTIQKDVPKLAVCVYHNPCDLWEIPALIKSLVPEYKIYLRHHTTSSLETVCYATI